MLKLIRPLALFIMIAAMASSYHTQLILFIRTWQVDTFTGVIAPFSVDALAVICAIAIGVKGARGKRLAVTVLVVTLGGSMAANFIAGSTLGSKIVHAAMVLIYLMAELVSGKVGTEDEKHSTPHAPAAAPTSPGMPPLEVEAPEVLAYREAAAELRKTSKLPSLKR